MSDISQKQKAGDNSNQFQAGTMIVNMGVDEKRVREIFDETFQVARRDMTAEAYEIACQRVAQFEDDFVPKFQKVEGALDALRDPAFQFTLTRAHRTAASTDRHADYEVLSELLVHRVERKDDRIKSTGINRAIEVVDSVSDDALTALTVAFAVEKLRPASHNVAEGLDTLDTVFGELCNGPLPQGYSWMEHLDILDAIRVSSIGSLKKLEEYYSERIPSYCTTGIRIDSDEFKMAQELLAENVLSSSFLSPNELDPQYVHLSISDESEISSLRITYQGLENGNMTTFTCSPSEAQQNALHKIYAMYTRDAQTVERFKTLFKEEISRRPHLRVVQDWWNNIPRVFDITPVGTALAYANAKRHAPEISPID